MKSICLWWMHLYVYKLILSIQLQYDSPNSMRILLETLIENISDNNG